MQLNHLEAGRVKEWKKDKCLIVFSVSEWKPNTDTGQKPLNLHEVMLSPLLLGLLLFFNC